MEKILILNSNSKPNEYSRTYKLVEALKSNIQGQDIKEVNLYDIDLPDIDREVMQAFDTLMNGGSFTDLDASVQEKLGKRQAILDDLKAADKVVISAPLWNLGFPSVLKKWIDTVVVNNETFKYTENGPVGLLKNKKAVILHTSGGNYIDTPYETGMNYLKNILGFIGFEQVDTFTAHSLDSGLLEEVLPQTIKEVEEYSKTF